MKINPVSVATGRALTDGPEKAKAIPALFSELESAIIENNELVERLGERLEPVMQHRPSNVDRKAENDNSPPCRPSMMLTISNYIQRLRMMNAKINMILSDLEL